jgi:hypothetical protein
MASIHPQIGEVGRDRRGDRPIDRLDRDHLVGRGSNETELKARGGYGPNGVSLHAGQLAYTAGCGPMVHVRSRMRASFDGALQLVVQICEEPE